MSGTDPDLPTPDDVERAAAILDGVAHRTPVLTSTWLDQRVGGTVALKAEIFQRIGAFKFRGAFVAVSRLDDAVRRAGVIAFSSGNHAQAVALAARLHDVPATIVMPHDAPDAKVAATRGYGAEIVRYDRYTEDRAQIAADLAETTGGALIPPYDHPDVIAGQATATRELLEQAGPLDLVVLPIGGGGLAAGAVLATAGTQTRVVAVEPVGRRAARDALAAGEVVQVEVPQTIADGQQTPNIGHRNLAVLLAGGATAVGVSDDALADAMRSLATRLKIVVEPSGAAGVAALLQHTIDATDARVGVVLSGGNVDTRRLAEILGAA